MRKTGRRQSESEQEIAEKPIALSKGKERPRKNLRTYPADAKRNVTKNLRKRKEGEFLNRFANWQTSESKMYLLGVL